MNRITIHCDRILGRIKPMHAVNNGPIIAGSDQTRGNGEAYRAARIPFARNHDAAFDSRYGGEHTVDVHSIFASFDADPYDPASYDFACTDHYIQQTESVGTRTFYRLGSKIEHGVKKYGTVMPRDFEKWAVICEHIIRHYTEGWAEGFHYDIAYWEIWNEPDLDPDDSTNKRCWSGTEADYARFYTVAATHLKSCFPHLKIGGPALAWNEDWLERFFERIKEAHPPMDFLSWHWYGTEPREMGAKACRIMDIARRYGYGEVESILNEWNYVRGWSREFVYSIETIIGMKGAAFTAACMCEGQHCPDTQMLMYYDARPTAFNGLFDLYTLRPLKGYYPFYMYGDLYALGQSAEVTAEGEDLYAVAATDGERLSVMAVSYAEDDSKHVGLRPVTVTVPGKSLEGARIRVLDENNTMTESFLARAEGEAVTLYLGRNAVVYIEA